jgi:autophagy-related protein 16-1
MARDNTIKLIDCRMFLPIGTCTDTNFKVGCNWSKCCFSSDGNYIVAGSNDGKIFIWQDTNLIHTLSKHK